MSAAQLGLFALPPMLRDTLGPYEAPLPLGTITPRDYQQRIDEAIDRELLTHRSTLVVAATGTGKTITLALQALQALKRGGVLVIAQEESPIEQAAQKLRHVCGVEVFIEKADRWAPAGAKFIVASMQSLRGERLADFKRRFPDVRTIFIDEAHHGVAPSYLTIAAEWPEAKLIGLTGTPDRTDKKALGILFESVAYRYDSVDAIRDAWLTPIEWRPMDITGVSLDAVGVRGDDLDQDALDKLVATQAGQIALAMVQHCKGLRSLAFCPGVQTAIVAAEALNRLQPGCARALHGDLDPGLKKAILASHKRGDFPYLLVCQMLREAYDDPRLRIVVDLAKTLSRLVWAQKAGRVARLWPVGIDHLLTVDERRKAIAASEKPRAIFLDANYGRHGHTLAGPIDVLGGRYDEAVRERAQAKLAQGGGDPLQLLEEAQRDIEAENRKKTAKRAAAASKARGEVLVGAARSACELFGVATETRDGVDRGAPDDNVALWLIERGVKNAESLTPLEARALKARLQERAARGLATFKQVEQLRKCKVPNPEQLTVGRAGMVMNALKHGGWVWNQTRMGHLLGRQPGEEG